MSGYSIIIPARHQSVRLPGKMLLDLAGKPLLQHSWERAMESTASGVWVATDDTRIADAVRGFGGRVLMTGDAACGTDRLARAAQMLGLADEHIVVNVQGDEPQLPARAMQQVAANLAAHRHCCAATLCVPIISMEEWRDPAVVKVVADGGGRALYFSRAPIPAQRDGDGVPPAARRHIGLYAYRVSLLRRFAAWPRAALERSERLEQLRLLANGAAIHVADAQAEVPAGVDTGADLERLRKQLGA